MSNVSKNLLVKGAKGKLGDQFVCKTRGRKAFIATLPVANPIAFAVDSGPACCPPGLFLSTVIAMEQLKQVLKWKQEGHSIIWPVYLITRIQRFINHPTCKAWFAILKVLTRSSNGLALRGNRFIEKIALSKLDGFCLKLLNHLERQALLILDDFGLQPMQQDVKLALLQILEERHGKHGTLITFPIANSSLSTGEKNYLDCLNV